MGIKMDKKLRKVSVLVIMIVASFAFTITASASTSRSLPVMNAFFSEGQSVAYSNAVGHTLSGYSNSTIMRSVTVTGTLGSSISPLTTRDINLYIYLDGQYYLIGYQTIPVGRFSATINISEYNLSPNNTYFIEFEGGRIIGSAMGACTITGGTITYNF